MHSRATRFRIFPMIIGVLVMRGSMCEPGSSQPTRTNPDLHTFSVHCLATIGLSHQISRRRSRSMDRCPHIPMSKRSLMTPISSKAPGRDRQHHHRLEVPLQRARRFATAHSARDLRTPRVNRGPEEHIFRRLVWRPFRTLTCLNRYVPLSNLKELVKLRSCRQRLC